MKTITVTSTRRARLYVRADLQGMQFGRLTVVGPDGKKWLCQCICGEFRTVSTGNLRRKTKPRRSCGCLRDEQATLSCNKHTTHGRSRTSEYNTWMTMIQRCTNPKSLQWADYGGRGITICERWLSSFENFISDMGARPAGLSLDRRNNDGNYEPLNCRWATRLEQSSNRRPASEWRRKVGH